MSAEQQRGARIAPAPATQLPLGVQLRDEATFAGFEPGDNGAAVAWLQARIGAGPERGWLWGRPESGRSHLLQASCRLAVDAGQRAIYLTPDVIRPAPQAALEGLEQCALVALDDLGELAGERAVEVALFDLCNRISERGGLLLLAADAAPLSYHWTLPDLASRLAAAAVFRLRPLSDQDKMAALQRRASLRGIELPLRTAEFILGRADRSPRALFALLDTLDTASLAAQRRLTVPFVREVLAQGEA